MKKTCVALAVLAAALATSATGHNAVVLKKALSGQKIDWTSGASYEGGVAPGTDDTVVIPDGMTACVDDDSVAFAGSRYRIQPVGRQSKLEANVSTNADWSAPFTSYLGDYEPGGFNREYGVFVKKGTGTLALRATWRFTGPAKNYDYLSSFAVSNGVLKLPTDATLTSDRMFHVHAITVSAPGTLYGPGGPKLQLFVCELWGDGLVTNVADSAVFSLDGSEGKPSVFGGRLCLSKSLQLRYGADFGLTGTQNTFPSVYVYEASTLGLVSFAGGWRQPSASGTTDALLTYGNSTIRYLGAGGETTSKPIYNYTGRNIVDAGVGGITLSGQIHIMESGMQVRPFVFTGTNGTDAVLGANITDRIKGTKNCPPYVIKDGSGTWNFGTVSRTWSGGVAVEEGTLKFGALGAAGVAGPLGVATNLYDEYVGDPDESHRVDYAFRLGDERADGLTEGTLTYTGSAAVDVTDRLTVLKGNGCLCNATGNDFRLRGVRALTSGLKTLALDGDSTASVNVIEDVTDGPVGRVGVVKRGAGTWRIARNQGFTGPIEVEAGTLVLHNPDHATYFRFATTENVGTTDSSYWDNSWHVRARLHELALYDADGNRVNTPVSAISSAALKESQGRMAQGGYVALSGVTTTLASLFDDSCTADHGWIAAGSPTNKHMQVTDPASWPIVEFRLADDAANVCSYDLVCRWEASAYKQCIPRGWKLWGSLDGASWRELATTNGAPVDKWLSNTWFSDKKTFAAGAVRTGLAVDTAIESGFSRPDNDYVRIASGARLVAHGLFTVKALRIDAAGAGTLEGATLAASGSLVLSNVERRAGGIEIPAAFVRVNGLANLANWSLTVNGRPTSRHVVVEDGRVYLKPQGSAVIIR